MDDAQKEYHQNLHIQIWSARRLADWIYHDVRLNCDDLAGPRTRERLEAINAQHGAEGVYGILAWWAVKSVFRMSKAMAHIGQQMPLLQTLLPEAISENHEHTNFDDVTRNMMTGAQFFVAVGNDDLETAESLFMAAYNSSFEDVMLVAYAVLNQAISISNEAMAVLEKDEF